MLVGLALVIFKPGFLATPSLSGKWEVVSGSLVFFREKSTIEFYPDGTINLGALSLKYNWSDNSHLKIDYGVFSEVYEAKLELDELTLRKIDNSSTLRFKRTR